VRGASHVAGVVCLFAGLSCARAPLAPAAADTTQAPLRATPRRSADRLTGINFDFALDAKLDGLRARVCFRGRPPQALQSGMLTDGFSVREAWLEGARGRRPLAFENARLSLVGVPSGSCIGYAIGFEATDGRAGRAAVQRHGDAIVANIAGWLLRPSTTLDRDVELRARFALPDGMRVSVPWPLSGDEYRIEHSALAFYAFAAFGRFETEQIEVDGARIDVAILDGLPPATRAAVVPWLQTAARTASLALGRFPRSRAQVIVLPSPAADEPVRYGMMNRGGGSSALMLLSANATREALERDWVALHEFCHLLHPFVQRDEAWLSEGLATYFAEVLRVRAGMQSKQYAWQRLYDGAQLGAGAGRGLRDETAQMYGSGSFRRVYWAGAAFALMADVAIRRHTHGQRSLASVLGDVLPSWVHEPRAFSAGEVAALIDGALGTPLVHDLMQRWVVGDELPNLDALYAKLGLEIGTDGVRPTDGAPETWIRDAIMQESAAPSSGAPAARTP
jgi:hypothetical protein